MRRPQNQLLFLHNVQGPTHEGDVAIALVASHLCKDVLVLDVATLAVLLLCEQQGRLGLGAHAGLNVLSLLRLARERVAKGHLQPAKASAF